MNLYNIMERKRTLLSLSIIVFLGTCDLDESDLALIAPGGSVEQPEVVASVPAPGAAGVEKDARIVIQFSRNMDDQRCIAAFSMQPHVNGFFDFFGNMMRFNPAKPLRQGTTYVITVSTECEDTDGRDLRVTYHASFAVGDVLGVPEVISAMGRNEDNGCTNNDPLIEIANFENDEFNGDNICAETPIYVNFSRPMDRSTVERAFSTSPGMVGSFQWSNGDRTLRFNPRDDLETGVTYVVTVGEPARDKSENNLEVSKSFSFTVGAEGDRPRVALVDGRIADITGSCSIADWEWASDIDPDDGLRNRTGVCTSAIAGDGNSPIVIHFTEDMDIARTDGVVNFGPGMMGVKSWSGPSPFCGDTEGTCDNDTSTLTFQPTQPWNSSATYTVNIGAAAEDMAGNRMGRDHSLSFTIGDDFTLPELDPAAACGSALCAFTLPNCSVDGLQPVENLEEGICNEAGETRFRLTFTKDMNEPVTAAAFAIVPEVEGALSWPAPNVLEFTPAQDMQLNRQYQISMGVGAEDRSGNNMATNFVRYFYTGDDTDAPPPRVVDVRTDTTDAGDGLCNGNTDVSIDGGFVEEICTINEGTPGEGAIFDIEFSEDMDQVAAAAAISFNPNISGVFSWLDPSTLRFYATSSLEGDRQYTMNVSQAARSAADKPMQDTYSQVFHTTAANAFPVVTQVVADRGTLQDCSDGNGLPVNLMLNEIHDVCRGNPTVNEIVVHFSEAMDVSSSVDAFSISPSVNGQYEWNGAQTVLTFRPDGPLNYGERYDIRISDRAESIHGYSLSEDVFISFVVGELDSAVPEVIGVNFERQDMGGCGGAGSPNDIIEAPAGSQPGGVPDLSEICIGDPIDIIFSEPMNQSNTSGAVSLSPLGSVAYSWPDPDRLRINPVLPLRGNEVYTLTVGATATDLSGNNLDQEFTLAFLTENVSPRVIAVGLESHGAGCSTPNSNGTALGSLPRNWTAGDCWWDESLPLTNATNYLFQAGDAACGTDSATDNFRLIFNRPMNPVATVNAVNLRRISPPTTFIQLATWQWTENNQVLTLSFTEQEADCGGGNQFGSGSYDLSRDPNDADAGFPLYIIEVDQTAEDADGERLPGSFQFAVEGD